MKKLFTALCATLFVGAISNTASATETQLPQQCQELFSNTEKLVSDAKKQPGTHIQINQIQNKLNQSKKQILEMELTTQIKSCNQGLARLSRLQKATKEAE